MGMYNKYNRSDFLENVVNTYSGIAEKDMLKSNWGLFKVKRATTYHYIKATDIQNPDLISIKVYNRPDLWWIIGKFNGINDWWNDLAIGDRLECPNILDIEDFYVATKAIL